MRRCSTTRRDNLLLAAHRAGNVAPGPRLARPRLRATSRGWKPRRRRSPPSSSGSRPAEILVPTARRRLRWQRSRRCVTRLPPWHFDADSGDAARCARSSARRTSPASASTRPGRGHRRRRRAARLRTVDPGQARSRTSRRLTVGARAREYVRLDAATRRNLETHRDAARRAGADAAVAARHLRHRHGQPAAAPCAAPPAARPRPPARHAARRRGGLQRRCRRRDVRATRCGRIADVERITARIALQSRAAARPRPGCARRCALLPGAASRLCACRADGGAAGDNSRADLAPQRRALARLLDRAIAPEPAAAGARRRRHRRRLRRRARRAARRSQHDCGAVPASTSRRASARAPASPI